MLQTRSLNTILEVPPAFLEELPYDTAKLEIRYSFPKKLYQEDEIILVTDGNADWLKESREGFPIRIAELQRCAEKIRSITENPLKREATWWKLLVSLATAERVKLPAATLSALEEAGIISSSPASGSIAMSREMKSTLRALITPSELDLLEFARLNFIPLDASSISSINWEDEDMLEDEPEISSAANSESEKMKKELKHLFESELEAMTSISKADKRFIMRCYRLADILHGSQYRNSKEPYIFHPAGATLLALRLGYSDPVGLGVILLHDIVEDAFPELIDFARQVACKVPASLNLSGDRDADCEYLIKKFFKGGSGIALAQGIIAISKPPYSTKEEKIIADDIYYRGKLKNEKDPKVILAKAFDRLNNLRTMQTLPLKKYTEQAIETAGYVLPLLKNIVTGKIPCAEEHQVIAKKLYKLLFNQIVVLLAAWALEKPGEWYERSASYQSENGVSDREHSIEIGVDLAFAEVSKFPEKLLSLGTDAEINSNLIRAFKEMIRRAHFEVPRDEGEAGHIYAEI
jgi:hypothetical protein